ncbi:enterobacterial virulence outer membrane protein [Vitreoscilla sp. C1]|uniref:Ail/Lom family outer membrane beta-barrel protein n=1 Tax=Vitreoscilla sp. (strain C1) TaxID=96942 RepID=UPI000CDC238D|nr:Ail/Lom family outer membrane beta-barrel protein [Vitreoscilla sp. C1]AUZ05430.1 enterobacterial virulence outer membrane protein [Vitreoscilla sp. C1]
MRFIPTLLLTSGLGLIAMNAQAQDAQGNPNTTVSIGYSHGKISGADKLNGVTAKYNYQFDQQPWGVMTNLTYMGGKQRNNITSSNQLYENDVDVDYYSAGVGPSYRINPNVNVYGVVGVAKADTKGTQKQNRTGRIYNIDNKDTNVMYGAGVQYNPAPNWSVDVGYESSRVNDGYDKRSMNAFNVGVGYRF